MESIGIHPSSLTFNRVGLKLPAERLIESSADASLRTKDQNPRNQNQLALAVSSVDEIEKTLKETGLTITNDTQQGYDPNTRKALRAYTSNHNQLSRSLAAETLVGIDDYA